MKLKIKEFFIQKKNNFKNKIILEEINKTLKLYSTPIDSKYVKGNNSLFFPVTMVTYIIRLIYGKYSSISMGIFDIRVNTQSENVKIFLQLKSPGIFIGRSGKDCDNFRQKCEEVFGRKVEIDLQEVKRDRNNPIYFSCDF